MLDFGFSEILLIFVLALIVLGPEKLPRVASQVGRWIGRARGMARQFREQLEEEINLEEARKSQQAMTRSPVAGSTPPPPIPPDTQIPATPADAHQALPGTTDHQAAMAAAAAPEPDPQVTYPPHYSHAHPTDELGRAIPAVDPAAPQMTASAAPSTEVDAPDPRQQDWIGGGGASTADKPAANASDAAYAPPHGRGT